MSFRPAAVLSSKSITLIFSHNLAKYSVFLANWKSIKQECWTTYSRNSKVNAGAYSPACRSSRCAKEGSSQQTLHSAPACAQMLESHTHVRLQNKRKAKTTIIMLNLCTCEQLCNAFWYHNTYLRSVAWSRMSSWFAGAYRISHWASVQIAMCSPTNQTAAADCDVIWRLE